MRDWLSPLCRILLPVAAAVGVVGCPLLGGPPAAVLVLSTSRLDFGADKTVLTFRVSKNATSSALPPFQIWTNDAWIECSPASGEVDNAQESVRVTVTVDRGPLAAGRGRGSVLVGAPGVATQAVLVDVWVWLDAAFSVDTATPFEGDSVSFTDRTELAYNAAPVSTWHWDFGDGQESSLPNPAHAYAAPGTYTVTLTVGNGAATDTETAQGAIRVLEKVAPGAAFRAANPYAAAGEPVQFYDESVGNTAAIEAWAWDFGDGTGSSAQNPAHTYAAPGFYDVTLMVVSAHGADTEEKEAFSRIRRTSFPFTIPTLDALPNATHVGMRVLEAPAGSHGFCRVVDGRFEFEDGHRFRGWGTSVTFEGAWPDHATAPLVAARLAKLGYNLIRFHHIDSTQALFKGQPDTRHFNAEVLDRMDYFINQLKVRGLYCNLNLHVSRTFTDADGIPAGDESPAGGKLITLFHPDVIALEKEHATNLLTHVNPYTGLSYVDDPAVALIEITNENFLWNAWFLGGLNVPAPRDPEALPQYYIDYLNADFNAWLLAKYGSRAALESAWAGSGYGLLAGEDPATGTVARLTVYEAFVFTAQRLGDLVRYYQGLESDFFAEMTRFLHEDLGVCVPVLGSQIYVGMPGLLAQSQADYTDSHGYWDHPFYEGNVYSPTTRFQAALNSWVADPTYRTGPGQIFNAGPIMAYSMSRIEGKPMTVSEWLAPAFQPYAYELPLLVSAYAGFHDWDAMYSYAFAQNDAEYVPGPLESVWQIANNPGHQVLTTMAALAFLRADVAAAPERISIHYSDADVFGDLLSKIPLYDSFFWWGKAVPLWAPYVVPMQRDLSAGGADSGPLELLQAADTGVYTSTTGELVWDVHVEGDEHVAVNSPRFQAIVGHIEGRTGLLDNLDVDGASSASVGLVSLDGEPIASCRSALIVAVAGQTAQGEELAYADGWLTWTPGVPPMDLDAVAATVTLRGLSRPGGVRLYPLAENGTRMPAMPIRVNGASVEFDLGVCPTPWYEMDVVESALVAD
ncbi:MAG: PKD domain-containing protein [Candidatus Hydrogenedentes bacterium]|nr:PKD domain-containing protein [Candidatus Hydrogenedentota bacterium]